MPKVANLNEADIAATRCLSLTAGLTRSQQNEQLSAAALAAAAFPTATPHGPREGPTAAAAAGVAVAAHCAQQQEQRGAPHLCMRFYKAQAIRALSIPEIEREVLLTRQTLTHLRLLQHAGITRRHKLVHARRLLRQLLTIRTEREANTGACERRQQQQDLLHAQQQLHLQQAQALQQLLRQNMTPEMQEGLRQVEMQLQQQHDEQRQWQERQ
ncbi:uncharacterized protein LOC113147361, partial [Cyclospora cayetanensis]|uniref:Uncharacterized protein LOC113147361 n=1 Tax=Cyclospora cayetanensis TaxID=88456 RepID=A0A6P6S0V9_9EIME